MLMLRPPLAAVAVAAAACRSRAMMRYRIYGIGCSMQRDARLHVIVHIIDGRLGRLLKEQ